MDRIDAMKVLIAAVDEGSLAAGGRKLGRSSTAVSRAIAFLEATVGVPLLHRTTRSIRLSDAGQLYATACRRFVNEYEEATALAASERSAPRGTLKITAPIIAGEDILRPVLDAFMEAFPAISVRLHLLDRPADLIDEGMDVALRIAHLADSTHVALWVGRVRRVVTAAPSYLSRCSRIVRPEDLQAHRIVAMTHFGIDTWSFPPAAGTAAPRSVQFRPSLTVNSVRSAVASTVAGRGVTRLFSYHVADRIRDGDLQAVLADCEPAPLPVSLVAPQGRLSVPKVRSFTDFAIPRLRARFAELSCEVPGKAAPPRGTG